MESSSSREFEIFAKFFSNSWNELMEMKYLIKYLLFGLIRRSKTYILASNNLFTDQKEDVYSFVNNTFKWRRSKKSNDAFKTFEWYVRIIRPKTHVYTNHSNRLRLYLCRKTFQILVTMSENSSYREKILQGTKKIVRVKERFELWRFE